ncbi:hypothetical protein NHX12_026788 [Muraenolepis orangiensis]|uniref:Uncharacterized protein n=1 Tax=Muraenolepis orangiensis TaxID=630683 RepID=A0A9Q0EN09_9TELE|nr:hypothetical protein NHX12_026788 [Muraenolepis orangiensis]
MAAVALALSRPPFTRERPPLVTLPAQKRNRIAIYPPSSSVLFDTAGFSNNVTLKGFTMHAEEILGMKCEAPLESELGVLSVSTVYGSAHNPSRNSLRRSVSQALDGKSLAEDSDVWDPHVQGHDSGMFMDDEEFVDTVKGFSTVRKEHTMFTDTNL